MFINASALRNAHAHAHFSSFKPTIFRHKLYTATHLVRCAFLYKYWECNEMHCHFAFHEQIGLLIYVRTFMCSRVSMRCVLILIAFIQNLWLCTFIFPWLFFSCVDVFAINKQLAFQPFWTVQNFKPVLCWYPVVTCAHCSSMCTMFYCKYPTNGNSRVNNRLQLWMKSGKKNEHIQTYIHYTKYVAVFIFSAAIDCTNLFSQTQKDLDGKIYNGKTIRETEK